MLMRKARRRRPTQLWDLFHQPPQTPTWTELPELARHRVLELLARLTEKERKQRQVPARGKEVGH